MGCVISIFFCEAVFAHGGVVQEDDLCVIKVNYLRAHFKIYQPRASGHKQFCEDLPLASESVFVMEYQHDALKGMPIDFRIIRDVTGKGRFARMEDVEEIDDLDSATVFYQEAVIEPDVFTVMHEFAEEGEFIGIVSATQPDTSKVYAAVFPFEVGFTGIGYWPFLHCRAGTAAAAVPHNEWSAQALDEGQVAEGGKRSIALRAVDRTHSSGLRGRRRATCQLLDAGGAAQITKFTAGYCTWNPRKACRLKMHV